MPATNVHDCLMPFMRTLVSTLSGPFVCHLASLYCVMLTLLQQPNSSPTRSGADVRQKLRSTLWKVFHSVLPRIIHKNQPFRDTALQFSAVTRLPQELADTITSYFIYHSSALASSLMCHSWYITAIPHLHQSSGKLQNCFFCLTKWNKRK